MAKPRILIVRDAAIGDVIMITPSIRYWSERGWWVDVVTKPQVGGAVLANNPHVNARLHLGKCESMEDRGKAIARLAKKHPYRHVLDLAGTCEGLYLFHSITREYYWTKEQRRAIAAGENYYQTCNKYAGMPQDSPDIYRPELYPSPIEERKWTQFRADNLGAPIVMVQLAGSSINKAYPFWPEVVKGLHAMHPRLICILTGGPEAVLLEAAVMESGAGCRRTMCTAQSENWSLRTSLIATKYADLVIGPETGVINASACFDTHKIPLLTHSTADNLCRGWRNCYPIQSPAHCSPCYKIVSACDKCNHKNTGTDLDAALLCMASIPPGEILKKAKEALKL